MKFYTIHRKDISLKQLLIYLVIVFTVFSIGDVLNTSDYLYPSIYKVLSAIFILAFSFLYRPIRKIYIAALNLTVLKSPTTYVWILIVYLAFFFLNHLFFKYDILMDDWVIKYHNMGISYLSISLSGFLLYLLTSCVLYPIWEELVFRISMTLFFTKFAPLFIGILLQSVVFGALHPGSQLLDGLFALLAFFLLYKTQSILPAIIFHLIYNLHSGLLLFYNFDYVPRW